MLSRPTTEQIILDCRAELLSVIEPAVADGPAKVALQMLENVLRNCAARAGHEVAWMAEEGDEMVAFAQQVTAGPTGTPNVRSALSAYDAGRSSSLHLNDVCATYDLAGDCLSTAIDAVMSASTAADTTATTDQLHREARRLLERRLAHENEIMGEWAFVGRS